MDWFNPNSKKSHLQMSQKCLDIYSPAVASIPTVLYQETSYQSHRCSAIEITFNAYTEFNACKLTGNVPCCKKRWTVSETPLVSMQPWEPIHYTTLINYNIARWRETCVWITVHSDEYLFIVLRVDSLNNTIKLLAIWLEINFKLLSMERGKA